MGAALVLVVIFEIRPVVEESRRARLEELKGLVRSREAAAALGTAPYGEGLDGVKDLVPIDHPGPEYATLYRRLKAVPLEEIPPGAEVPPVREAGGEGKPLPPEPDLPAVPRALREEPRDALARDALRTEYSILREEPARFRGRPLRIDALLVAAGQQSVDIGPGEVAWVHRTWLLDPAGNEGYVVDLIDDPSEPLPAPESRTLVTTPAVFLRIGTYVGRTPAGEIAVEGKERRIEAPHLLARRLRRFEERTTEEAWDHRMSFLAGALMVLVFLLLAGWIALAFLVRRTAHPRSLLPGPAGPPGPAPRKLPAWKRERIRAATWRLIPLARRGPVLRRRPDAPAHPVRRILLHAGVFALIAGVIVLVKLAPWEREPTAQEKLADAEERWQEVRGVEKKIEEGAASLSREDRAALGRALRAFVATSDATHARLDALQVRKEGAGKEAADLGRKLLELKLRVLDTEAVLEASREGAGGADRPPLAAAGFFVPLQGAVARERQAEADLKSVEAPGAQGAGAGERRSRAAAVQQALEQCLTDYRGLGVRVREGLTREDLGPSHLPFLATLEAEEKRASEALRRVEELLR